MIWKKKFGCAAYGKYGEPMKSNLNSNIGKIGSMFSSRPQPITLDELDKGSGFTKRFSK